MRRGAFFDSIASVLSHVLHRHGMETKVFEHKLRRQWPGIVSEPIAAHTRPDQIRFKKLYLIVENSVWLQQLTFLKPELIAKVNAAAGTAVITDVVLRVGDIRRGDEGARGSGFEVEPETLTHELRTSNFEPSASLKEEAGSHAASVTDPEVRAKLTEVMAHALAQQEESPDRRRSVEQAHSKRREG